MSDFVIRGALANPASQSAPLVNVGQSHSDEISSQEYTVLIGNRKWISEKNFIEIPQDIENKLLTQEKLGQTALLAAVDGKITSFVFLDILFALTTFDPRQTPSLTLDHYI